MSHNVAMMPDAPKVQLYEAVGRLRRGGEGQLGAHGLVTPFDATAGRVDNLAGPADLLCAALSACILKNVKRFSQMLPFRYESATVLVVAEREDQPPRIVRMRYELEISASWLKNAFASCERPLLCVQTKRTSCEVMSAPRRSAGR
jgi:uncharacterized OsmC-like protein